MNILIMENDMVKCKKIVNYISKKTEKIRVCGIVNNEREAISEFDLGKVDLFLFDLDKAKVVGYDLIKYITLKNLRKHRKSIIAITKDLKLAELLKTNPFVNHCFTKPVGLKVVYERIEEVANEKLNYTDEKIIKERIKRQLDILSFNFSYNGTKFLQEILYEMYINKNKFYDNLSRDIYPIIAKRHGKTVNTVKCDITQATKVMYYDCKEEVIMKYFNYKIPVKPRAKEVIFTILRHLEA